MGGLKEEVASSQEPVARMMRGRILLLIALSASGSSRAPNDVDRMNRFVQEYNRYVTTMQGGVIDVKQWARVRKAWRAVNGE
jgi:hypothetical protein